LVFAVGRDPGVVQNRVQPRIEVGTGPERAEADVRMQHRFLDQIFGVVLVWCQAQCGAEELIDQRDRVSLEPLG
jgi:hypothetical protein